MGIIGAGRGVGVTHLSVWMANYLTGVRRERTAVLEWNEHGDFARMREFCCGVEKCEIVRKADCFKVLDAEYYANAGAAELAACMNEDYRRIIVDYGEITGGNILECARCDRKVIVGALSEWQAKAFLEEAKKAAKRDQSWSYTAAFGSEEARRELMKKLRLVCLRIPASVDAFAVTRGDMRFFADLLKENK